ncbi:hypothetical protein EVAR_44339_1 [Eumeta japonica]|uniref:Uncharacterized protein n=1 Tax=Eumeta variegata TaxID=151549 RepID=A0A4C1XBT6_EUMVA|nr:hypothetical protein EVAR_44339_1 [Eumeta japonica]
MSYVRRAIRWMNSSTVSMRRSRAMTSFKTYRPAPTIICSTMFCWAWILFLCIAEQSVYHAGAVYVSWERMYSLYRATLDRSGRSNRRTGRSMLRAALLWWITCST